MAKDHDLNAAAKGAGRFLGSLRDALAAASRDDDLHVYGKPAATTAELVPTVAVPSPPAPALLAPPISEVSASSREARTSMNDKAHPPSAAEAAKEARGQAPKAPSNDRHVEFETPPTTRVVRGTPSPKSTGAADASARTTLVRGKQQVARGEFHQDPVVGWLVIVGGPGLGAHRPIFEGNNTLGRAATQRIPLDFGDDAISSEEQAFVRYDSADRSFLFVPNLAKTNVVSVNDKRPTAAVVLGAMDVITVGRTQLVFVPFCGPDFDWGELTETKKS